MRPLQQEIIRDLNVRASVDPRDAKPEAIARRRAVRGGEAGDRFG